MAVSYSIKNRRLQRAGQSPIPHPLGVLPNFLFLLVPLELDRRNADPRQFSPVGLFISRRFELLALAIGNEQWLVAALVLSGRETLRYLLKITGRSDKIRARRSWRFVLLPAEVLETGLFGGGKSRDTT